MVERNRQHAKWLLRAVFISCAAGFAHSASAQLVSGTGDVQPGRSRLTGRSAAT